MEIINDLPIGFPINIIISLSMQQTSHAKGPSQDNHAVDPLHGLMTFFLWYTFFLHEQISWDLINDRMEAQFREITSSRQWALRRSDSFDIDMYANVMQHGTAWCRGHTESDAQGSMMRKLPMLILQHAQRAHDLSLMQKGSRTTRCEY